MAEVFDLPIEIILETVQKLRVRKRVFAYEMLIEKRIMQAGGTPVIEGNRAYFFYRNESEEEVSVTGDWNGWRNGIDVMQRIHPASTVYYVKKEFPVDSRLSYRFLSEDHGSFNDPANPRSLQEVFGNNTYLQMPAYQDPLYLETPGRAIPRGVIKSFPINSAIRGDRFSREVAIYIPNGMRIRGKVSFLYVHDGIEAMTIGRFINVLDNLYYHEPHTRKMIVVFVPPVDRHVEYMMNPKFAKWTAKVLVPQVEKFLKVSSQRELRTISGSSLGGLISAYTALMHPNVFGNVAAQSASFWFDEKALISAFASKKKLALRFFIHTGTINDALDGSRELLEVLQRKGYDIRYRETNESHNWANWSAKYVEIVKWAGAAITK